MKKRGKGESEPSGKPGKGSAAPPKSRRPRLLKLSRRPHPPAIARIPVPDLLHHEPRMALTDEGDGLGAYRHIAASASDFLIPGGRILVEIGPAQGKSVASLFQAAGLGETRIIPDLDGRDRVVLARMP